MTPAQHMAKANRALDSARLLLDVGDVDGACNRAYYAMFDAARAALLDVNAPAEPAAIKTHSGLITAFSLYLVKSGRIALDLGRALNKVAEIRLIADYTGDAVTLERAEWCLVQADKFVGAVHATLST